METEDDIEVGSILCFTPSTTMLIGGILITPATDGVIMIVIVVVLLRVVLPLMICIEFIVWRPG